MTRSPRPPPATMDPATSAELAAREEAVTEAEIDAALADARLRGREAGLEAQRSTLLARAGWIDSVAASLERWTEGADVSDGGALHGLGGGAAREEADLDTYVRRSATLLLARSAMIATREELLARRRGQQESRAREIDSLEAAMVRVEVRIAARERLLLAAVRSLESQVAASGKPPLPSLPARPQVRSGVTAPIRPSDIPKDIDVPSRRTSGSRLIAPALELDDASPALRAAALSAGLEVPPPVPVRLRLGNAPLQRGKIELDAASKTLLASVDAAPTVGALVALQSEGDADPLVLAAVVRRVLPAGDGGGAAVVLAPHGWSGEDWRRLEAVVAALS